MTTKTKKKREGPPMLKPGMCKLSVFDLMPSPENELLYAPVLPTDPAVMDLSKNIGKNGVQEALKVTRDRFVVSGHRRLVAAQRAGLTKVPVEVLRCSRASMAKDAYIQLLRSFNHQRVKSLDEVLREELTDVDEDTAYESLLNDRRTRSEVGPVEGRISLGAVKRRSPISAAKAPMLDAVQAVIESQRDFWPLSDRRIHYALLNNPPLRHASKHKSRYVNDEHSYQSLVELLTRARLEGRISFEAIADETRPVTTWQTWDNPQAFVRKSIQDFGTGYFRSLLRSQPNHIEIVGEKNTLAGTLTPIASKFCMPLTIGRGFCSLPPRFEMAQRYEKSGKERLVLLIVSDFDPDGEAIAESFARSMRDDFDVDKIDAIKVALTYEQTQDFELPPGLKAKKGSSNYSSFVSKFGTDVFEVEALDPVQLQEILEEAICSVLDLELFNAEVDAERSDSTFIANSKNRMLAAMRDLYTPNNTENGQA